MKTKFACLLLSVLLFGACKKEVTLHDGEYLVFGHFYGMCVGESCVEIFRLEPNQLLEDSKDQYPSYQQFYSANFDQLLSTSDFNTVKDLTDFFPSDLLNEPDGAIGTPDAGDWGGLYIEYKKDGVHRFWLIDKMRSNVPTKYHDFMTKVEEKIDLLK